MENDHQRIQNESKRIRAVVGGVGLSLYQRRTSPLHFGSRKLLAKHQDGRIELGMLRKPFKFAEHQSQHLILTRAPIYCWNTRRTYCKMRCPIIIATV